MNQPISFDEVSELIVNAIRDEPFFNKDVLIPKVRAILKGFKVDFAAAAYSAIEKPSQTAKRIREIERLNFEKVFWREKLEDIISKEKINEYYNDLDNERRIRGFSKK